MDAKKTSKRADKRTEEVRSRCYGKSLLQEEVLTMIRSDSKEERAEARRRAGIITRSGKLSPIYKR